MRQKSGIVLLMPFRSCIGQKGLTFEPFKQPAQRQSIHNRTGSWGTFPFLDLNVHRRERGKLETTNYCKPTHFGAYLAFESHHPLSAKRLAVSTLFKRLDNITAGENTKKQVKKDRFAWSCYPGDFIDKTKVCGLRGAMVSVVVFWAKGRGFKSAHCCSHTVQKPSISPKLFGQCTLNSSLLFTIYHLLSTYPKSRNDMSTSKSQ